MYKVKSLQGKIFFFTLLPVLLTMAVAGYSAFQIILKHVEKQQQNHMTSYAKNQAIRLSYHMDIYLQNFEKISHDRPFELYLKTFQEKALVRQLILQQDSFPVVSIIEKGFRLLQVKRGHVSHIFKRVHFDSLTRKAMAADGKSVFSITAMHSELGEPALELAVFKKGYFKEEEDALLYGAVPLARITDALIKEPFGEKGFFCVVSRDATILASPVAGSIGQKIRDEGKGGEKIISALQTMRPFYARRMLFDHDSVVAISPLKKANVSVAVVLPYDEFISPPNELRNKVILISAAAVVLSAFIAFFIARVITAPLKKLEDATAKVAAGNLGLQLSCDSDDEIGKLTDSFNFMSISLTRLVQREKDQAAFAASQAVDKRRIQELSASEKKYRSLVNNIPGFVYTGYPDWTAEIISDVEALSGYTKQDFDSGRINWLMLLHPDDKAGFLSESKPLSIKPVSMVQEYRIIKKNGEICWVEDHKTSVFNHHGIFQGVDGIAFDITVRKEMEYNLVNTRKKAELANRAKTEFLANMSHELRTPMHAILSYAQFGLHRIDKVPREKLQEYFREIKDSGDRLILLLNDLLDLAKLEAGSMSYTMEQRNIVDTVNRVVTEFKAAAEEQGITLELSAPDEPGIGWFDDARIGQVIGNLLSNALKFTENGKSILITVDRILRSPDNHIKVTVSDQGIGIPQEELKTIFDKFIQSSSTKSGAGGTGLGLSICGQIIQAHHGRIWAENNRKGGATFSFIFPADRRTSPKAETH